jgi:DNA-binding transcriptional ArsR family regulator
MDGQVGAPPPELAAFAEVMRTLGDETRLRILRALRAAPLCVCDLTDAVGSSQPLVSHHLKALKSAGLVGCRRDGPWVYYAVRRETFEALGLGALWADGGILAEPLPAAAHTAAGAPPTTST